MPVSSVSSGVSGVTTLVGCPDVSSFVRGLETVSPRDGKVAVAAHHYVHGGQSLAGEERGIAACFRRFFAMFQMRFDGPIMEAKYVQFMSPGVMTAPTLLVIGTLLTLLRLWFFFDAPPELPSVWNQTLSIIHAVVYAAIAVAAVAYTFLTSRDEDIPVDAFARRYRMQEAFVVVALYISELFHLFSQNPVRECLSQHGDDIDWNDRRFCFAVAQTPMTMYSPLIFPMRFDLVILLYLIYPVGEAATLIFDPLPIMNGDTIWYRMLVISVFNGIVALLLHRRESKSRSDFLDSQKLVMEEMLLQARTGDVEELLSSLCSLSQLVPLVRHQLVVDHAETCTVVVGVLNDPTTWSPVFRPKAAASSVDHLYNAFDQRRIKYGVERLGLTGDRYVAGVGLRSKAPSGTPHDARPLVFLAIAMSRVVNEIRKSDYDVQVRVGISTGEGRGMMVDWGKLQYVPFGAAIDRAMRRAVTAMPQQVAVTERTLRYCPPGTFRLDVKKISEKDTRIIVLGVANKEDAKTVIGPAAVSQEQASHHLDEWRNATCSTREAKIESENIAELHSAESALKKNQSLSCTPFPIQSNDFGAFTAQSEGALLGMSNIAVALVLLASVALFHALNATSVTFFVLWMVAAVPMLACHVTMIEKSHILLFGGQIAADVFAINAILFSETSPVNARIDAVFFTLGFLTILAGCGVSWILTTGCCTVLIVYGTVLAVVLPDRSHSHLKFSALKYVGLFLALCVVAFACRLREIAARSVKIREVLYTAYAIAAQKQLELHEEVLDMLIPRYAVRVVVERREGSHRCMVEALPDVAFLAIRFPSTPRFTMTELQGRLKFLKSVIVPHLVHLTVIQICGDIVALAGPVGGAYKEAHSPRGAALGIPIRRHTRSADNATAAIVTIMIQVASRFPLCALAASRCDGLAVIIGKDQPYYDVQGPASRIARAILLAALDGCMYCTEALARDSPASIWGDYDDRVVLEEAVAWRLRGAGVVRVRRLCIPGMQPYSPGGRLHSAGTSTSEMPSLLDNVGALDTSSSHSNEGTHLQPLGRNPLAALGSISEDHTSHTSTTSSLHSVLPQQEAPIFPPLEGRDAASSADTNLSEEET